jgi:hypothetical protein
MTRIPNIPILLLLLTLASLSVLPSGTLLKEVTAQPLPPTTIETTANAPFQVIGNVSSIHFNTKDGHYYVNGTLKYNGHVTVTNPLAVVYFTEKALGVKETGIINIPKAMNPGDTYNYNSDTGYTKNQVDRLRG